MTGKRVAALMFPLVVVVTGPRLASAQVVPTALASMRSCVDQSIVGAAALYETPSDEGVKDVTVLLAGWNLTPGKHAVHIHEVGACTPTCTAAGSHLDLGPFGNNVPVTANHPYHSGDLINIVAGPTGTGLMLHVTNRIAVSAGKMSIFDADGAAVVVHALADLYCPDTSDPNCAGGGRVACGVLVRVQ